MILKYIWERTGTMQHRWPVTHVTVEGLIRRAEGVGYKLHMDNFFSSPDFFDDTQTRAVKWCGTSKTESLRNAGGFDNKTQISNRVTYMLGWKVTWQ
jgi:hypothetical protein